MFEKIFGGEWIYLSSMHRVSKKTGARQKGYHYIDGYVEKNPIESALRYKASLNYAVLKVQSWIDTTDTLDELKAEAEQFNNIIKTQNDTINTENAQSQFVEEKRRKETLAQLR